ncbi:MAG: aldehyde dehydrogenase family protein, partial [Bradymonadaceae bacterium]
MPEADETDALDRKLDVLRDHADDWAELALDRRIAMARSLLDRTLETAAEQVELGVEAKGGEPSSAIEAEEWLAGPVVSARNIRLLVQTLEAIDEDGDPPIDPSDVRRRSDGGLAVEVFPDTLWDRLLYAGLSAEVWMRDDVRTYDELLESTAHFYREDEPDPGVALVLGAGNVASITPLDALYRLYAHGQTVLVKMNPVNDYLGPILEERFAEFIDAGFVRFAYGGAQVGDYLCRHDEVDAIHVTGSDRTHDAIVWGTGDEAQRRREQDDPRVDKPITSELGNVSPVVVLPGPWSSGDVDFHAANIASQLANNAGFNCNAARVLIRPEGWETGDRLVDGVESVLADVGTRPAYYPGARETFEEMTDDRDAVDRIGDPADGELPWAILRDLDPDADDPLYR